MVECTSKQGGVARKVGFVAQPAMSPLGVGPVATARPGVLDHWLHEPGNTVTSMPATAPASARCEPSTRSHSMRRRVNRPSLRHWRGLRGSPRLREIRAIEVGPRGQVDGSGDVSRDRVVRLGLASVALGRAHVEQNAPGRPGFGIVDRRDSSPQLFEFDGAARGHEVAHLERKSRRRPCRQAAVQHAHLVDP